MSIKEKSRRLLLIKRRHNLLVKLKEYHNWSSTAKNISLVRAVIQVIEEANEKHHIAEDCYG